MMRRYLLGIVLVGLVGCSPELAPSSGTFGPGAASPEEAVSQLQAALAEGDFQSASSLAVPGQAALASLAEGAAFIQVADALENADAKVASNFWSGFAQGAGEVLAESANIEFLGTESESGIEFSLVAVNSPGAERRMVTRDVEGHRIDLFASFAVSVAQRMLSPVELLLNSSGEDATVILLELQNVVPSLLVAANEEGLPPESVQSILQLVEMITRIR